LPWQIRNRGLFFEERALSEGEFISLTKTCGLPVSESLLRWYQSNALLLPALLLDGERKYSRWQLLEVQELEESRRRVLDTYDFVPLRRQAHRSWTKLIEINRSSLFAGSPEYKKWLALLVLVQNRYVARARGHLNQSQQRFSVLDEPWARPYVEGEYAERIKDDRPLREVGLDLDSAIQLRLRVGVGLRHDDPLRAWYRLIRFVPNRWREKLYGAARLAQELYVADRLLQRYLSDVSGVQQPDLEDLGARSRRDVQVFYGRLIDYRDPDFREVVLTEFGLHPAPRGWLFVEGPTEVELFKAMFEMFGFPMHYIGVEIESLGGVGNVPRMLEVIDRLRRPIAAGEEVSGHRMIQRPITAVWVVVDRESPIGEKVVPEFTKRGLSHCLVVATRDLERDNFARELQAPLEALLGQPVSSEDLATWAGGIGSLEKFVKRKLARRKHFRKLDLVPAYTALLRADYETSADWTFTHPILNSALNILRIVLHDLPNPDPALKDLGAFGY